MAAMTAATTSTTTNHSSNAKIKACGSSNGTASQVAARSCSISPSSSSFDYSTTGFSATEASMVNAPHQARSCDSPFPPSSSLYATLNSFKHLDDYEYCRERRLKDNASKKFGLIIQSVKAKLNELQVAAAVSQVACPITSTTNTTNTKEDDDSDMAHDEARVSDCSYFNQILKRHMKRYRKNVNHHHR